MRRNNANVLLAKTAILRRSKPSEFQEHVGRDAVRNRWGLPWGKLGFFQREKERVHIAPVPIRLLPVKLVNSTNPKEMWESPGSHWFIRMNGKLFEWPAIPRTAAAISIIINFSSTSKHWPFPCGYSGASATRSIDWLQVIHVYCSRKLVLTIR